MGCRLAARLQQAPRRRFTEKAVRPKKEVRSPKVEQLLLDFENLKTGMVKIELLKFRDFFAWSILNLECCVLRKLGCLIVWSLKIVTLKPITSGNVKIEC